MKDPLKGRPYLMVLLAFFGVLLFIDAPCSRLFDPDETRYAEISREMLESGDYVTPRLNGSHYFEKPPLTYWLNAASMALFGPSKFPARLPTRLATLGVVLLILFCLAGFSSSNASLWAALVYLSSPLPFALGRIVLTDGLLTFCLALSFFSLRGFLQKLEEGRPSAGYQAGLSLGIALGLLTKGLIGVLFPGAVLLLWVALLGRWKILPKIIFSWVPLISLALASPWFLYMEKLHPGFLHFFFYQQHFLRYTTSLFDRPGSLFYFVAVFLGGFLPWTFFFGEGLMSHFSFRRRYWLTHSDDLFFLLWFFVILLFFSFSHSKLIPYLLPAFPAAACLLGKWMTAWEREAVPLWIIQAFFLTSAIPVGFVWGMKSGFFSEYHLLPHALVIGMVVLIGVWSGLYAAHKTGRGSFPYAASWSGVYVILILAVPHFVNDYSAGSLAKTAAKAGGDSIVCYQYFSPSFPWVLKRSGIPVASYSGELASDGVKLPSLFWSRDTFWSKWNSSEKLVVYVRRGDSGQFYEPHRKSPFVVAENGSSFILANFEPVINNT